MRGPFGERCRFGVVRMSTQLFASVKGLLCLFFFLEKKHQQLSAKRNLPQAKAPATRLHVGQRGESIFIPGSIYDLDFSPGGTLANCARFFNTAG